MRMKNDDTQKVLIISVQAIISGISRSQEFGAGRGIPMSSTRSSRPRTARCNSALSSCAAMNPHTHSGLFPEMARTEERTEAELFSNQQSDVRHRVGTDVNVLPAFHFQVGELARDYELRAPLLAPSRARNRSTPLPRRLQLFNL